MATGAGHSRRDFLGFTAAAVGSWAVPIGFEALRQNAWASSSVGFGPLHPVRDENTGLELLQLPEGFRYISYGWKGDRMADGVATPANHDGMGVIRVDDGIVTLVRNHECTDARQPFSSNVTPFDTKGAGGCTNLQFDTAAGKWVKAWSSLVGTARNCAGGVTPWGTWLSCEETVYGPGSSKDGRPFLFEEDHGFVFEVPHDQVSTPIPLKAMGRFVHEAVAVDPVTGYVYQTEDDSTAGFYRFVPTKRGDLSAGGRLQMMSVKGHLELRRGVPLNRPLDVTWVDIDDPTRAHTAGTQDGHGVFQQGKERQGTTFARLEGCWHGNASVFVVSTSGGDKKAGQIFRYDPKHENITLVFESPSVDVLDAPDNITISPRGGIVLCEDGNRLPQKLQCLTLSGDLFELAANNMVLSSGDYGTFRGDFRKEEWCGVTFSPDGRWLFANLQTPGLTVAITGPWEAAGI